MGGQPQGLPLQELSRFVLAMTAGWRLLPAAAKERARQATSTRLQGRPLWAPEPPNRRGIWAGNHKGCPYRNCRGSCWRYVNANPIFTWRRDPRYKPAVDGEDAPPFLPVEVAPDAPPPEPAGLSDGRIEIALSNGHRVSAVGSFDMDALRRVVRVLGG